MNQVAAIRQPTPSPRQAHPGFNKKTQLTARFVANTMSQSINEMIFLKRTRRPVILLALRVPSPDATQGFLTITRKPLQWEFKQIRRSLNTCWPKRQCNLPKAKYVAKQPLPDEFPFRSARSLGVVLLHALPIISKKTRIIRCPGDPRGKMSGRGSCVFFQSAYSLGSDRPNYAF